ncbi:MAG: NRDE family protein [Cytophagales bacterium]|nr:NRDE family protein [Cytophagales bacterium]
MIVDFLKQKARIAGLQQPCNNQAGDEAKDRTIRHPLQIIQLRLQPFHFKSRNRDVNQPNSFMCTVSYIPLEEEDFLLTHNRDEKTERGAMASEPKLLKYEGLQFIAPVDQKAQGTWIYTDSKKRTLCLLNGAFKKHVPKPPYARSRGRIIMELNSFNSVQIFLDAVELSGVEPFTLIVIDQSKGDVILHELKWDGNQKHIMRLDDRKPRLWSSATLYPSNVHKAREKLFENWLQNQFDKSGSSVLDFHQIGRYDHVSTPIWLKSDHIFTVSTSQIHRRKEAAEFSYIDYLNGTQKTLQIKLP